MRLTNEERETVIVFNEAEKMAHIETCNSRWKAEIYKIKEEHPGKIKIVKEEDEDGFLSVDLPKRYVKLRGPRLLSDEQKERLSERGRALAAMRKESTKAQSD